MEVWVVLVFFLLLFWRQYFLHWRRDGIGKSAQVLLQLLVAFGHPSLVGVIHFEFLMQHKDQFLAPVAFQAFGNLPAAGLNPGMTEFRKLVRVASPADDGPYDQLCGVEVWRGGLGGAYLLPTLSSVGASVAPPCFRFHTPLIEPDVRICRIRLSEKTHAIAEAIACDV